MFHVKQPLQSTLKFHVKQSSSPGPVLIAL